MAQDKKWEELYEEVKPILYKYGFLSTNSWKRKGVSLKHAADRLFGIYIEAVTRFENRFTKEAEEGIGPVSSWHLATENELGKDIADISLISEYLLLIGYSFENLLKGIMMADHPEFFKPDRKIKKISTHNLAHLCERCGVEIKPQEKELLVELTDQIEWVGKYPAPLVVSRMPASQRFKNFSHNPDTILCKEIKNIVENLYLKFFNELNHREQQ